VTVIEPDPLQIVANKWIPSQVVYIHINQWLLREIGFG